MKTKIFGISTDHNHAEGLKRLRNYLQNECTKKQLMEFLGIDYKYRNEYSLETLVEKVLDYGEKKKDWNSIIDDFEIDDVRVCSECNGLMIEGVYADGDYYCSEKCLDKGLGIDKYLELSDDTEDTEYFYTEW